MNKEETKDKFFEMARSKKYSSIQKINNQVFASLFMKEKLRRHNWSLIWPFLNKWIDEGNQVITTARTIKRGDWK